MAKFDLAYDHTLGREGRTLTETPEDPGGMTYCGISRKKNPDWAGWIRIDQIILGAQAFPGAVDAASKDSTLLALVKGFYQELYWDWLNLTGLDDQRLAQEIFDTAVNCGPGTVAVFVQKIINVFNRGGKNWPDVKIDGHMGPVTVSVLNQALNYDAGYRAIIFVSLNSLQNVFYIENTLKNPRLENFVFGLTDKRVVNDLKDLFQASSNT